jgi:hypothetical protein
LIFRHCEEPKQKRITDIASKIGMTDQGAVRTSIMPKLVSDLIGNEPYELHTYTHTINDEPTSRSYYTTQLLKPASRILYDKSDDLKKLIANVQRSEAPIIVIVWEHLKIPEMIHHLLRTKKLPNYEKTTKQIWKKLGGKQYPLVQKYQKSLPTTADPIEYCSPEFTAENTDVRNYYIKAPDNIAYSIVWDLDLRTGVYKVHPGVLIKRVKDSPGLYQILKYELHSPQ